MLPWYGSHGHIIVGVERNLFPDERLILDFSYITTFPEEDLAFTTLNLFSMVFIFIHDFYCARIVIIRTFRFLGSFAT